MAEHNGLCASTHMQINRKSEYYSSANCLNCVDLENLLKEAHLEISSLQYINKLLYKELNKGASTNTESEWTRTTSRPHISTPNHNCTVNPGALQPPQPIYTTNRFSILEKLYNPAAESEATLTRNTGTIDRLNHCHTYKRKLHQNKKSVSYNANNDHGRNSLQQPTHCQIPRRDPLDQHSLEKEPNLTSRKHRPNPLVSANNTNANDKVNHTDHSTTEHIPTIANGEISETLNSNVNLINAKEDNMQNFINELKIELTNQLSSYSLNRKHKIICVGDSHTRGFSTILTNLMGDNFEFYSVVKPGSNSNQLLETARQEIKKLSSHDALVICSGTNDLATNKPTLAFQNI